MPFAAPRPCRSSGCPKLATVGGYCDDHRRAEWRRENRERSGEKHFYGSQAWKAARAAVLRDEPLCRPCDSQERVTLATLVDHIVPVKQGGSQLDRGNLQPMCDHCHAVKRQTERGGGGSNP